MNLKSLRVKGLKPFVTEQFVDLESLPGKLIALTGPNGAGKSSWLSLYPAAVIPSNKKFLFMPGRGSRTTLASLSVSRDSFVEVKFEYGDQDYTIRHSIDGQTGKTECSLTDSNGNAVLKGKSGVTEYLQWASERLLPPEVFFGSVFSGQRTRGMLGMDPAERKQLILKVLGLDRYEKLASLASEHKRKSEQALAVASGKLSELKGDSTAYCEEQIAKWTSELRTAEESLRLGNATLNDLRSKNEAAQKLCAEYDAKVLRRRELVAQITYTQGRVGAIDRRLTDNKAILAEEAAIRNAVAEVVNLEAALDVKQEMDRDLRTKHNEVAGYLAVSKTELSALDRQLGALERQIEQSDVALAERDSVLAAIEEVKALESELIVADLGRAGALALLEDLQGQTISGLGDRNARLLGHHKTIRDGSANPVQISTLAIADDVEADRRSKEQPEALREAKAAWQRADMAVKDVAAKLATVRRIADRLGELESTEKRKAQHLAELQKVLGEIEQVRPGIVEREKTCGELSARISTNEAEARTLSQEIDALKPTAGKLSALEIAKAGNEDLLHQRSGLEKELEETEHKRAGIVLEEPPETVNLVPYEAAVKGTQFTVINATSYLGVAQDGLARARATEARRIELEAEVKSSGQDAAEWKRLADDLSNRGVPALIVDAAGPELTVLANDLLRASGDSRFSVSVETVRMDSTGKKEIEDCLISISDSREVEPKTGASGGEEVFINEALSLAVTMLACKHGGMKHPTLVRDETGASLDSGYGAAYIAMLRRAGEIVDASRIIFVSHSAELQGLADSRIVVDQGVITVG